MESYHKPPRRKQLRLPNYDYRQSGAYYVTICTHNREMLFGEVSYVGAHPCVRPSTAGSMIKDKLFSLEQKFDGVKIDYYCVMPNHVHFILLKQGAHMGAPLHEIIKWYKTQTTNEYIKLVKQGVLLPFINIFGNEIIMSMFFAAKTIYTKSGNTSRIILQDGFLTDFLK